MKRTGPLKVRPTAVLVEDGKLLILRQRVTESLPREWSLPGGTLEFGETVQECLIREMNEETALHIRVGDLLYVCDRIQDGRHILHLTFAVIRTGGSLHVGAEPETDAYPIAEARMVPITELTNYGFGAAFQKLAIDDFPDRGCYRGDVTNIGL